MVYFRNFVVKFKIYWNNLHRAMQPYLNHDYERYLDLIMVGAGIHPLPGAEPWKKNCMILYRLLGFYQLMMGIAKVGFGVRNGNDTIALCASIALLTAQVAVYAKIYILGHYDEAVQQSKTFVNSNCSCSRDPDYDATVRRSHVRVPGTVTFAIFVLLCCDQVILSIPNSARDSLIGIPEQFHVLGPMPARLLKETYGLMLCIFWGCGYYISPLTIMPLLNGLKHELMIVARGYETVADLVDKNNAAGTSRRLFGSVLTLKHFKQKLGITVEQHVEVLRIVHLMQPLVSYIYAIIYYSVMIIVSLFVFVVIRSEITLLTMALGLTSALFLGECYLWCRMIESIEDTMEMIADCVTPLGFELQHSGDNHLEYKEIQTSLMIVQHNASKSGWFSCAGIFLMSVESFGNLCMIVYKFATFLLDFE